MKTPSAGCGYDPKTDRQPPEYPSSTWTRWGEAQAAQRYGRGIVCYQTAGHGGFHLSAGRNALVHEAWRDEEGWYEEDCDWAIVAVTFPQFFHQEVVEEAHRCAQRWHAEEYAIVHRPAA